MTVKLEDLSDLPKPAIIEEIGYEAILNRRKDLFALIAAAEGLDLGEFLMLESAVETILLEEASYSEMLLRSRINQVYRSRLLYFADGADLDHVSEEYGVVRLANETDHELRVRTRLKNRGSSSAGPDDWWRYHALRASVEVEDAAVTRPTFPIPAPGEKRGDITISILAKTNDGIPSDGLIATVQTYLNDLSIRGVTTRPTVVAATAKTLNITADIWLQPGADQNVFTTLETKFRAAFAAERALGWSVTRSWLMAQLHLPGVQRVDLITPAAEIVVAAHEAPKLGTIALTYKGRDY